MFFSIDPGGDVPIYEQIVQQVKLAVADNVLVGGQMVPSVRQLANELAINPNTIARAYQQLQSDLVLEPLRGRGMVVRRDAIKRCTKARNSLVADGVRRALINALAGGMTPDELRELFESELAEQTEFLAEQDERQQQNGQSESGQSDGD
jgi:GntR family transcriptional regulator